MLPCCKFCHYTFFSLSPFSCLLSYSFYFSPKQKKNILNLVEKKMCLLLDSSNQVSIYPVSQNSCIYTCPSSPNFPILSRVAVLYLLLAWYFPSNKSYQCVIIHAKCTSLRLSMWLTVGKSYVSSHTTFSFIFPLFFKVLFILLSWSTIVAQDFTPFLRNVVFVTWSDLAKLKLNLMNYKKSQITDKIIKS